MKQNKKQKTLLFRLFQNMIVLVISLLIFILGVFFIWVATLKTPDFEGFNDRLVKNSTKLYDRTGKVLLYDIHNDIKRTVIPKEEISLYVKNATVAIEDSEFYNHKGVRFKSLVRAILANLQQGGFSQGGSTITQQIIKNSLLTQDKKISRKIKEWILALKIEREMGKDDILAIYLNETPYGGNLYGVKEAAQAFFGVTPIDLTLTQSAYLAAIPKAPTYYSPYGSHKKELDERAGVVLGRMKELGFITEEEYTQAKNDLVVFLPPVKVGIIAPHFVFYIKDYLTEKYGSDAVDSGGLVVITTLDVKLQEKAEVVVKKHALQNEKDYDASNAALVATDPQTGEILTMVGSRDYFDKEIDGNFNVATAERQPGSSFKPFVYATAFTKGYRPDTVLFDVPTEFNTSCNAYGVAVSTTQDRCYHPQNYDNVFKGPISLRNALGGSRNVPSVQLLYLVGINDTINTARQMGISTLTDPNRYGLTLVLGGGEVSLLEMTTAYATFGNDGKYIKPTGVLEVKDSKGIVLEKSSIREVQAIPENTARLISDILSDNNARLSLFGVSNFINFGSQYDVAGKTGTTDKNVDAWMMGYSPSLAVGVWSGNNDNTPMKKGSAISGRLWRDFMDVALPTRPNVRFTPPSLPVNNSIKPVLRGVWQGGTSVVIDSISGKLATILTPEETKKEVVVSNVHSILHWVNKNDPTGPYPTNPQEDSQYSHWEATVADWWRYNSFAYQSYSNENIPIQYDDVHTELNKPQFSLASPLSLGTHPLQNPLNITVAYNPQSKYQFKKFDIYINNQFIETTNSISRTLVPESYGINEVGQYTLRVVVYDLVYNKSEKSIIINFN